MREFAAGLAGLLAGLMVMAFIILTSPLVTQKDFRNECLNKTNMVLIETKEKILCVQKGSLIILDELKK